MKERKIKGNQALIDKLNEALTNELTAINQYFLHARILQDWGLTTIGDIEYKAAIDEMKHADQLIKRVLFLQGLPNVQRVGKISIGQSVTEIFESDLKLENEAIPALKDAMEEASKVKDFVTEDLLLTILASEEEHVDWLETELNLFKEVGKENYLQKRMRS